MKSRLTSLLSLILTIWLLALACTPDVPKEEAKVRFKASFEKETIGSVHQQWKSSDRIAVSGSSNAFKQSKSNGGEYAVFNGKAVPAQQDYAAMPFEALA